MRSGRSSHIGRSIVWVAAALALLWVRPGWAAELALREVHVKDVLVDPRNNQPVVLLQEVEGKTLLPIWVGPAEARAIAMALRQVTPPRPMTHDLMRSIIGGLEGRVLRVVITELKGGTFYAHIYMESPSRKFTVDSRPSDAIALAMRTHSPIFVRSEVMKTGITPSGVGRMTHREDLGLILQEMTPALAHFFGGGSTKGLLVSQVREGAPAARAGLKRGDVIFEVEGKAVRSVEAFEKAYAAHSGGMTVAFRRGSRGQVRRTRIEYGSTSR